MHKVCYMLFVYQMFQIVSSRLSLEDLDNLFSQQDCVEASTISALNSESTDKVFGLKNDLEPTDMDNISTQTKVAAFQINELAQHNEITFEYLLLSETGPPHNRIFKIALNLGEEKYEAEGTSLKKAKQTVAQIALQNTLYEIPPTKPLNDQILTPTVILNNVATRLGLSVKYYQEDCIKLSKSNSVGKNKKTYYEKLNASIYHEQSNGGEEYQNKGPFCMVVEIDNEEFRGSAHTIQAAKHAAASNALEDMKKRAFHQDNVCSLDETSESCYQKKLALKSPVSQIYEIGQKNNLPVDFDVIKEEGKSHTRKFTTQCKVGDFVTIGEGTSKKESKKIAAQNMLEELSDIVDVKITESEIVNNLQSKKKKKRKKKSLRKLNQETLTSVADILNSFWPASETNDVQTNPTDRKRSLDQIEDQPKNNKNLKTAIGPKSKLLEISNLLKFEVQFRSLSKHGDQFYGLVDLGIRPPYVCLGKALLQDLVFDEAAKRGLKFLSKSGILDELALDQKINIKSLKLEEWSKWFETTVIIEKKPDHEEL